MDRITTWAQGPNSKTVSWQPAFSRKCEKTVRDSQWTEKWRLTLQDFIYLFWIDFFFFLVKVQVPQNQNKWIELKFQESPESSCKLIIMALTLSTSICTSTSKAVHRLSPSQYLRLFPGHHRKPTNLLLPRHPPTRFTLAFSRRRNNNPVTISSSKKKKVRKWTELVCSVPEKARETKKENGTLKF